MVLSSIRRQRRQAGRQRERRREEEAEEEGAGWLQGERGGENGWGSACVSTPAPAAGLGSSAAVSVLVLGVLPGPGSWGKSLIHHHVLHKFLSVTGVGVLPFKKVALCDSYLLFGRQSWWGASEHCVETWYIMWSCMKSQATCVYMGANRRVTMTNPGMTSCFCAFGLKRRGLHYREYDYHNDATTKSSWNPLCLVIKQFCFWKISILLLYCTLCRSMTKMPFEYPDNLTKQSFMMLKWISSCGYIM